MKLHLTKLSFVFVLALFCGTNTEVQADETVDINRISPEVMKSYQTRNRGMVVTWLAPQYVEAMGISAGATKYEVKSVTNELKNYTIVCVMAKSFDVFSEKSATPQDIRKTMRLVDKNGKSYKPLDDSEISTMAKIYANALNSGFERGAKQTITVVMFPAKDSKGNSIADATKKGKFKVEYGALSVEWDLPLNSLKKNLTSNR